jgi:hypothetical protein
LAMVLARGPRPKRLGPRSASGKYPEYNHKEGAPPRVHRSSFLCFIHVLLLTRVIYLRVNPHPPIMDEETMTDCLKTNGFEYTMCLQLTRIANTLERLLRISEMSL